jgi:uncharacterized protein
VTRLRDTLRPAEVPADRLVACLGLISDTHYPERLAALPPVVLDVFRGVDLILHAGDVGTLDVLDRLSAAAPVVAVHGNDERYPEAQRELPYQQVLALGGHRIVLSHAHYPDLAQEMESRKSDDWGPKLSRRASFGHSAGARIVVYGHTHIPTDVERDGVRLINPGALASGNHATRQLLKTVALLYLRDDGEPFTVHVDLAQPDRRCVFEIDWAAGFRAAFEDRTQRSILAPDVRDAYARQLPIIRAADPASFDALRDAFLASAHRCWSGEQDVLTRDDLLAVIDAAEGVAPAVRKQLLDALG